MSLEIGPWSIPDTWVWTTMGEVSAVVGGGTPSTQEPKYWEKGQIPWITPADLSGYGGKYISHGERRITERGLANSGAQLLPKGSVLFSSRAPIGYIAIAWQRIATSQGFKSFVLDSRVAPEYAYFYLHRAKELAIALASGTTFLEISGKKAAQIPFPLPPPEEQRRVAEVLDIQLGRLADIRLTLERIQSKLRRQRASVLKAAVEGKLVAPTDAEMTRREGRVYEPSSKLLDWALVPRQYDSEGSTGTVSAYSRNTDSEMPTASHNEPTKAFRGHFFSLPEGWSCLRLGQLLAEPLSNGRSVPTASGGFPVLRLTALKLGRIDLSERKEGNWTRLEAEPFLVKRGDFLVSRGNGSIRLVGLGGLVETDPDDVAYPDTLIRVRIKPDILLPRLLSHFWNSLVVRSQIQGRAKTTAGIHKINQRDLEGIVIPVPPFLEQVTLTENIDSLLEEARLAESAIQKSLNNERRLRRSILKLAFEGRLIDQDPQNEPARQLLKRIQGERSDSATARRKTTRASTNCLREP